MIRVLFVCLGNICRSPMAEAVFRHKVETAGLSTLIEADSAGTGPWHVGNPPHSGVARLLEKFGIPLNHIGRQVNQSDLYEFDYVLAMDNGNLAGIARLGGGTASVGLLLEYAPGLGITEVPDPYMNGRFEETYRLVDEATTCLLKAIRREHGI